MYLIGNKNPLTDLLLKFKNLIYFWSGLKNECLKN
jgi:hypothetical protein